MKKEETKSELTKEDIDQLINKFEVVASLLTGNTVKVTHTNDIYTQSFNNQTICLTISEYPNN